ncbi:MAG: phospholipase [Gemmatimonadales bacterium]
MTRAFGVRLMQDRKTRRPLAFALILTLPTCGPPSHETAKLADPWSSGRLTFHPASNHDSTAGKFVAGLHPVFPDKPEGAWVYAPASAATKTKAPVLLLLHGAGGSGVRIIRMLADAADQAGIIIVAPKSVGATWDAMNGPIGADVVNIDRALSRVSLEYNVDPTRISIAGFSDGATYALALGRLNGTLFRNIVAFSPGMLIPILPRGSPPTFISHGTRDTILPIDITSRRFVPELERQGYTVEYHEFDGPHAVPPEIAALAMRWIAEH